MKEALPWLISCVTLFTMWQLGNKKWWAWLVGLGAQGLWIAFAILFKAWGLLPLSAALTVVYTRNLWKWRHPAPTPMLGGRIPIREDPNMPENLIAFVHVSSGKAITAEDVKKALVQGGRFSKMMNLPPEGPIITPREE